MKTTITETIPATEREVVIIICDRCHKDLTELSKDRVCIMCKADVCGVCAGYSWDIYGTSKQLICKACTVVGNKYMNAAEELRKSLKGLIKVHLEMWRAECVRLRKENENE